ncbi:MAG: 50S ribosomal protein L21 [Sphaerochaetaceae bacterium]|nr:50S ribosomal protein L21 [Sphaerochaetaceae bacterium]
MYALVEILGRQYKAEVGAQLQVDRLSQEAGSALEIEKVLAVVDGDNAKFGTPYVQGAKVTATVGEEVKGEKVKVYKFHRRKGYRRTQGHRQKYTLITINKIEG